MSRLNMATFVTLLSLGWSVSALAQDEGMSREEIANDLRAISKQVGSVNIPSAQRSLPPASSTTSGSEVTSSAERRALENLNRQESLRIQEQILERVQQAPN
jgi:hypothetical protein